MITSTKKSTKKEKPDSAELKSWRENGRPWDENLSLAAFRRDWGSLAVFDAASAQKAFYEHEQLLLSGHPEIESLPRFQSRSDIEDKGLEVGGMFLGMMRWPHKTDMPQGRFCFLSEPLPHYQMRWLEVYNREEEIGSVGYTDDVFWPHIGTKTTVWMSYTFSEVMSLRGGVRTARGNVFIGGLGLGYTAAKILRKKGVKHVTVVERDEGLANWMRPSFEATFGPRVTIIGDDAYKQLDGQGDQFDSVVMDIWEGYGHDKYDYEWQDRKDRLESKGIRCWSWG